MKIRIILIFLAIVVFSGCKVRQLPDEKIEQTENYVKLKDSIREIVVNRTINDTLYYHVPLRETNDKYIDSVVNLEIAKMLKQINIQKHSGDNRFEFLYNELKKQMELFININETQTTKEAVKETEIKETTKDTKEYVEVEKPLTKWQKTNLFLGKFLIGFVLVVVGYKIIKVLNIKLL